LALLVVSSPLHTNGEETPSGSIYTVYIKLVCISYLQTPPRSISFYSDGNFGPLSVNDKTAFFFDIHHRWNKQANMISLSV
jgi:hypothetical protein